MTSDAGDYRAQLLATARAAAVPVATQVLADLPPDEIAGMTADELRALVVVLAEAASGDMPRLRALAGTRGRLSRRFRYPQRPVRPRRRFRPPHRPAAETAYDLIAPDWDDAGYEFRREADAEMADPAPAARALVLWQCQELTDRATARLDVSEPAGAAA